MEFLAGGLELSRDVAKALAEVRQFTLQRSGVALLVRRAGDQRIALPRRTATELLEADDEQRRLVGVGEGFDEQSDGFVVVLGLEAHIVLQGRLARGGHVPQPGAHGGAQVGVEEIEQVEARDTVRFEELRRLSGEPHHVVVSIHDQISRGVGRDHASGPTLDIVCDRWRKTPLRGRTFCGAGDAQKREGGRCIPPRIESMPFVDRIEQAGLGTDALRRAEEKLPLRSEAVMEGRQHPLLQGRLEIDHQVTAGDEIESGERWVFHEIMLREQAHLSEILRHAVGPVFLNEVLRQALVGDVGCDRSGIDPGAGDLDRTFIDIGREDLDGTRAPGPPQPFLQEDRDRIGLLAGRAAGDPDTDRLRERRIGKQGFQGPFDQCLERLGVPKEACDADQQLTKEKLGLCRGRPELLDVDAGVIDLQHLHSPLDAAHERTALVLREVSPQPAMQHRADRVQLIVNIGLDAVLALVGVEHRSMTLIVQQGLGHRLDPEHMIDEAGRHCALGHTLLGMMIEVGLAERQAAAFLDGRHTDGAVAPVTREDDPDGIFLLVFGEGRQENVDRHAARRGRRGALQLQDTVLDREDGVRRRYIDVVGFDLGSGHGLQDRHGGVGADDRDEGAFPVGIEVLNEHKGHAAVRRHE